MEECRHANAAVESYGIFHPPQSLVFFFQSSPSPAFLASLSTYSSHLSVGLPRLILPSSRNSAALFGSLSSAILPTCPAHCSLLLNSLSVTLLCTPVCPRYSCYFSYPVVFSHTCSLCCCRSVIAKVSVQYRHADVTSYKCSWPCPFCLFEIRRSAITPQLLYTCLLRPVLSDVGLGLHLSPSSRLRTMPFIDRGLHNTILLSQFLPLQLDVQLFRGVFSLVAYVQHFLLQPDEIQ